MSRYQRLGLAPLTREELAAGLAELGLVAEFAAGDPLELTGSLECAGEPVDVRLPAALGAVEDFGFLLSPPALVCGEYDRALLERRLVAPLTQAVALARARAAAAAAGLAVDEQVAADGTRRLTLSLRPARE
ncbi:MAG: hypothetical protein JNL82_39080 [Myxococcales bacterium]|jgi:hypothetical protein|nr:hypothetical protein [Myxococcales bacterium]